MWQHLLWSRWWGFFAPAIFIQSNWGRIQAPFLLLLMWPSGTHVQKTGRVDLCSGNRFLASSYVAAEEEVSHAKETIDMKISWRFFTSSRGTPWITSSEGPNGQSAEAHGWTLPSNLHRFHNSYFMLACTYLGACQGRWRKQEGHYSVVRNIFKK